MMVGGPGAFALTLFFITDPLVVRTRTKAFERGFEEGRRAGVPTFINDPKIPNYSLWVKAGTQWLVLGVFTNGVLVEAVPMVRAAVNRGFVTKPTVVSREEFLRKWRPQ